MSGQVARTRITAQGGGGSDPSNPKPRDAVGPSADEFAKLATRGSFVTETPQPGNKTFQMRDKRQMEHAKFEPWTPTDEALMEPWTPPAPARCGVCSRLLPEPAATGRPRLTCSPACRQRRARALGRILCGKNNVASNPCDDGNMHQTTDELMTVSAAAKALSISEGGVRVKADRGELPCIRTTTGLRLFHRRDVQHAVRSKSARAK